jgi:hypothetical protein
MLSAAIELLRWHYAGGFGDSRVFTVTGNAYRLRIDDEPLAQRKPQQMQEWLEQRLAAAWARAERILQARIRMTL